MDRSAWEVPIPSSTKNMKEHIEQDRPVAIDNNTQESKASYQTMLNCVQKDGYKRSWLFGSGMISRKEVF